MIPENKRRPKGGAPTCGSIRKPGPGKDVYSSECSVDNKCGLRTLRPVTHP